MKISFILPVLVVIFLFAGPADGTLNKISGNVPIFIGESNVDISSGLNGCHTIGWWQNGRDVNSGPADQNITIVPLNTASNLIFHYNFTPDVFTGYTGAWYCVDKAPYYPVFTLVSPNISLEIWNLDNNTDVSGQSVPFGTNFTYRIDTNLDAALNYAYRTNENPTDSFYTVAMTDPQGRPVSNLYTGNAGNSKTVILPFDVHPFITVSPYYGKNMASWFHAARDPQGTQVYPAGTYTISVNADLNNMLVAYGSSSTPDTTGLITDTKTLTLVQEAMVTTTPSILQPSAAQPAANGSPIQTATVSAATSSPVAMKTTYSPLPAWIPLAALCFGGIAIMVFRR